jgi:hypothetical protein
MHFCLSACQLVCLCSCLSACLSDVLYFRLSMSSCQHAYLLACMLVCLCSFLSPCLAAWMHACLPLLLSAHYISRRPMLLTKLILSYLSNSFSSVPVSPCIRSSICEQSNCLSACYSTTYLPIFIRSCRLFVCKGS